MKETHLAILMAGLALLSSTDSGILQEDKLNFKKESLSTRTTSKLPTTPVKNNQHQPNPDRVGTRSTSRDVTRSQLKEVEENPEGFTKAGYTLRESIFFQNLGYLHRPRASIDVSVEIGYDSIPDSLRALYSLALKILHLTVKATHPIGERHKYSQNQKNPTFLAPDDTWPQNYPKAERFCREHNLQLVSPSGSDQIFQVLNEAKRRDLRKLWIGTYYDLQTTRHLLTSTLDPVTTEYRKWSVTLDEETSGRPQKDRLLDWKQWGDNEDARLELWPSETPVRFNFKTRYSTTEPEGKYLLNGTTKTERKTNRDKLKLGQTSAFDKLNYYTHTRSQYHGPRSGVLCWDGNTNKQSPDPGPSPYPWEGTQQYLASTAQVMMATYDEARKALQRLQGKYHLTTQGPMWFEPQNMTTSNPISRAARDISSNRTSRNAVATGAKSFFKIFSGIPVFGALGSIFDLIDSQKQGRINQDLAAQIHTAALDIRKNSETLTTHELHLGDLRRATQEIRRELTALYTYLEKLQDTTMTVLVVTLINNKFQAYVTRYYNALGQLEATLKALQGERGHQEVVSEAEIRDLEQRLISPHGLRLNPALQTARAFAFATPDRTHSSLTALTTLIATEKPEAIYTAISLPYKQGTQLVITDLGYSTFSTPDMSNELFTPLSQAEAAACNGRICNPDQPTLPKYSPTAQDRCSVRVLSGATTKGACHARPYNASSYVKRIKGGFLYGVLNPTRITVSCDSYEPSGGPKQNTYHELQGTGLLAVHRGCSVRMGDDRRIYPPETLPLYGVTQVKSTLYKLTGHVTSVTRLISSEKPEHSFYKFSKTAGMVKNIKPTLIIFVATISGLIVLGLALACCLFNRQHSNVQRLKKIFRYWMSMVHPAFSTRDRVTYNRTPKPTLARLLNIFIPTTRARSAIETLETRDAMANRHRISMARRYHPVASEDNEPTSGRTLPPPYTSTTTANDISLPVRIPRTESRGRRLLRRASTIYRGRTFVSSPQRQDELEALNQELNRPTEGTGARLKNTGTTPSHETSDEAMYMEMAPPSSLPVPSSALHEDIIPSAPAQVPGTTATLSRVRRRGEDRPSTPPLGRTRPPRTSILDMTENTYHIIPAPEQPIIPPYSAPSTPVTLPTLKKTSKPTIATKPQTPNPPPTPPTGARK